MLILLRLNGSKGLFEQGKVGQIDLAIAVEISLLPSGPDPKVCLEHAEVGQVDIAVEIGVAWYGNHVDGHFNRFRLEIGVDRSILERIAAVEAGIASIDKGSIAGEL